MCDVCVAEGALRRGGIKIIWDDAPKTTNPVLFYASGFAEGPARYDLYVEGEEPLLARDWHHTDCLATVAGRFGLDVVWNCVPKPVQQWVMGKRERPTDKELYEYNRKHWDQRRRRRTRMTAAAEGIAHQLENLGMRRGKRLTAVQVSDVLGKAELLFHSWHEKRAAPKRKGKPLTTRLLNNLRVYDQTPASA